MVAEPENAYHGVEECEGFPVSNVDIGGLLHWAETGPDPADEVVDGGAGQQAMGVDEDGQSLPALTAIAGSGRVSL